MRSPDLPNFTDKLNHPDGKNEATEAQNKITVGWIRFYDVTWMDLLCTKIAKEKLGANIAKTSSLVIFIKKKCYLFNHCVNWATFFLNYNFLWSTKKDSFEKREKKENKSENL